MILVTGGAGYIGSHFVDLAVRCGETVGVIDNLSLGNRESIPDIVKYKWLGTSGKLSTNIRAILSELKQSNEHVEAVVHFAASAYVDESVYNPEKYYHNNVSETLALLNEIRDFKIDKIIYSSSCATYGIPDLLPILEDHPQRPINPYGRTKLAVEGMLQDYAEAYGLKFCALRYFNAAGAHPNGILGESHHPETHLIPRLFFAALGKIAQMKLYGDGIRDFVHVSDLARGHLLALQQLRAGNCPSFINLSSNTGYSLSEIVAKCEEVTQMHIPVHYGAGRKGDPLALIGSHKLAEKSLGWLPEYGIQEILKTAWQWEQKRRF